MVHVPEHFCSGQSSAAERIHMALLTWSGARNRRSSHRRHVQRRLSPLHHEYAVQRVRTTCASPGHPLDAHDFAWQLTSCTFATAIAPRESRRAFPEIRGDALLRFAGA